MAALLAACGSGSSNSSSVKAAGTTSSASTSSTASSDGNSNSDRQEIVQMIEDYGRNPRKLCTTYALPTMLTRQFGGRAACLAAASQPGAKDTGVRVTSVMVKGRQATARRVNTHPAGFQSDVFLVKVGGRWRVQASLPAAS